MSSLLEHRASQGGINHAAGLLVGAWSLLPVTGFGMAAAAGQSLALVQAPHG